jgi:Tfp pilus assembly protein PilP
MRIRLALALVVGLATPAAAQSVATTQAAANVPPPTAAGNTDETSGYDYHPDGRRDPFVSLLRRATDTQRLPVGARPAGLAGLTAGEVNLKGILRGRDGYFAILLGADSRSYIVRAGDRLLDGTVRTIAADSLVIVQQLNDPLAPQKQREVRKSLRQIEEAK